MVKSLGVYRFEAEEDVEAPLVQVILILELFYRAHQKGDVLRDQDIRLHTRRIHLELWPEIKAQLSQMGLIRSLEGGGMILARDLNEVLFPKHAHVQGRGEQTIVDLGDGANKALFRLSVGAGGSRCDDEGRVRRAQFRLSDPAEGDLLSHQATLRKGAR